MTNNAPLVPETDTANRWRAPIERAKLTILAADDDPEDLYILRRRLQNITHWDIELLEFEDWPSAKAEFDRRAVHILFLDYYLGTDEAPDIIREVRAARDMRPIIVLTGKGDEETVTEVLRAGATDYLSKLTLSEESLERSISWVLREQDLRREKLALEQELREVQKMEAVGTLASGIAHDFNNILTGILGEVQLAEFQARSDSIRRHLTNIENSCERMTELIRRLLVFGRSGRTTLSPVSLRKAVEDVQVILEHTLSKQVELKVELCDEPCNTFATTSGLQQILLNLCLNAADAMAYGGELSIRVHRLEPDDGFRLTHGALTRDAYYVIEAHDTGCGIPTEVRERIFEPFFTTKELSSRKGTGLGLAVVWQLVREFHGLVSVYSEVGEGTTFRVYLPRYSDEEEGESEEAHSSSIPRGSEAILVVDDEPAVLDVTVRILQHLGYAVYCAEDGPSAVRTLEELQGEIDCAIVDLSMPRMGGVECAERLREIQPGIRVIFASGHNMADQEEELRARGADAIVQKPMQLTDLARRMRSVLGE